MKKTIYEQAVELMDQTEIDFYQSDLYLKRTETSQRLVDEYKFKGNVKIFTSQIDKRFWYEIPFGYDPYWKARNPKK